jgi:hypothetical protein
MQKLYFTAKIAKVAKVNEEKRSKNTKVQLLARNVTHQHFLLNLKTFAYLAIFAVKEPFAMGQFGIFVDKSR